MLILLGLPAWASPGLASVMPRACIRQVIKPTVPSWFHILLKAVLQASVPLFPQGRATMVPCNRQPGRAAGCFLVAPVPPPGGVYLYGPSTVDRLARFAHAPAI